MSAPTPVTPALLRSMPLSHPGEDGDKEERGRALAIAGSTMVPGGALLAGIGVLRAGAGKLQIATVASLAPQLGIAVPEAMVIGLPETEAGGIAPEAAESLVERCNRCDAVLIGPGMLDPPATVALTARLMERLSGPSMVLDAGALEALGDGRSLPRHLAGCAVLTPHAGEMAALLGIAKAEVAADPLGAARTAAARLQAVIALKGSRTHVVTPSGDAWVYEDGCVGLATSGSGDTLAGIVAGLLARGTPPTAAAVWGVYLHGEAGNRLARRLGPLGYLARELLAEVPVAMAEASDRQSPLRGA